VTATRSALEGAARVGFSGVLETAVEQAICSGGKFKSAALTDDARFVDVGDYVALVRKDGRTPQGRRRWVVLKVEARNGRAGRGAWAA